MKQTHGWWWPDHEEHMIDWMAGAKNRIRLNDRWTYQGRKQIATLKHCARTQFRTAVDVGGHVGLWSWNLAHAFKRVHAFEPVAVHRECFAKNTAGLNNIRMHPIALGDREGRINIWSEKGSSGNSFIKGEGDIPLARLDDILDRDDDTIDLIKVDCEGSEESVLRGAEQTILHCKPVVIVEQKRDMHDRFGLPHLGAVTFLKSLGYKVAEEISGDFIMVPA